MNPSRQANYIADRRRHGGVRDDLSLSAVAGCEPLNAMKMCHSAHGFLTSTEDQNIDKQSLLQCRSTCKCH